ncbi:hypothetical protein [Microbacterium sp. B24]|uniref:hypothetical protein n=1 Tax=Microbacterium sp. B24 TaxID=95616 RepID=UPI00042859A3|nr:hypothetical protein [Microbacterium sp. B24]
MTSAQALPGDAAHDDGIARAVRAVEAVIAERDDALAKLAAIATIVNDPTIPVSTRLLRASETLA